MAAERRCSGQVGITTLGDNDLSPVVSGVTVTVISSVVTAPSVGMAVVSVVVRFGAGISIGISRSFHNMLSFWLLFFSRSLPPVSVWVPITVISSVVTAPSVGMAIISIVPRFGAGISISSWGGSGSGCSFSITFPVSVGISVIATPSIVSTVGRISIVSIVIRFGAGFGLR